VVDVGGCGGGGGDEGRTWAALLVVLVVLVVWVVDRGGCGWGGGRAWAAPGPLIDTAAALYKSCVALTLEHREEQNQNEEWNDQP